MPCGRAPALLPIATTNRRTLRSVSDGIPRTLPPCPWASRAVDADCKGYPWTSCPLSLHRRPSPPWSPVRWRRSRYLPWRDRTSVRFGHSDGREIGSVLGL